MKSIAYPISSTETPGSIIEFKRKRKYSHRINIQGSVCIYKLGMDGIAIIPALVHDNQLICKMIEHRNTVYIYPALYDI